MRWQGRRPKSGFVLGAAIAAFAATACFGAPPPSDGGGSAPPPPPSECQGSSSASTSSSESAPIPPDQARDKARAAAAQSPERTPDGKIPLVTVEEGAGGQTQATQTRVSSPDEAGTVAEQKASAGNVVAVEIDKPVHAETATDPDRSQQWALDNVHFEAAWPTADGTGETVAVVDTGVQATHPDLSGPPSQVLQGRVFLNQAAYPGSPGGTTDDNGHGTHVAGIIAAVANNGEGIAGAAPGVKILPVKVLDSTGSGWTSDVANGITWAASNGGANVINLSLGGSGFSSAEQTAIQNARNSGAVVVAAAGNEGLDGNTVSYPGNFPEVIAVGATTRSNAVASYSTSCPYVDLAAPGGSAGGCSPSSSCNVLSTWNDGGYEAIAGTSMATPHVSAAAALVQEGHAAFTPIQVCTQLIRTALDLGPAGKDNGFGYGLIRPDVAVGGEAPSGPTCP